MRGLGKPPASTAWVSAFLVADTATQVAFKVAAEILGAGAFDTAWVASAVTSPSVWCAVGLYLATFVTWMRILEHMELSRAFPLTAMTYVTVPLAGWFLFQETPTASQVGGIALIVAGVLLVGRHGREEPVSMRQEASLELS